jgi:hypothetical protein
MTQDPRTSPGTRARTHAQTRTLPRLATIRVQVRKFMMRSLGDRAPAERSRRSIERGLDNQWIERVGVIAMNSDDKLLAELILTVDWEKYSVHLSQGRTEVTLDPRWPDETALEIVAAADLFYDFWSSQDLKTSCYLTYRPELDRDEINRQLGFRSAAQRSWAATPEQVLKDAIPELSEVNVEMFMVLDE